MSDEQFRDEMARRRAKLHLTKNDNLIGCPLCTVEKPATPFGTSPVMTNSSLILIRPTPH